jgi:hypothetical protein
MPMDLDYMTWAEMYGNGLQTAILKRITVKVNTTIRKVLIEVQIGLLGVGVGIQAQCAKKFFIAKG